MHGKCLCARNRRTKREEGRTGEEKAKLKKVVDMERNADPLDNERREW